MYKKFEELCKDRGITASQVSKETGIATSTLSEWKKGLYTPKVDKLMILSEFFNVPLETFVRKDMAH